MVGLVLTVQYSSIPTHSQAFIVFRYKMQNKIHLYNFESHETTSSEILAFLKIYHRSIRFPQVYFVSYCIFSIFIVSKFIRYPFRLLFHYWLPIKFIKSTLLKKSLSLSRSLSLNPHSSVLTDQSGTYALLGLWV